MTQTVDLLMFGGTRNTGLHIASQAIKRGMGVMVMVRPDSDCSALQALGIQTITGDAFFYNDCVNAVQYACPSHVISVLGGKNKEGKRIDSVGNINIINALKETHAIQRFVLMTSMGCGEQFADLPEQVKKFLGEALSAKTFAENELKTSQLPWSIVRPGGLNNEPGAGHFCILDAPDRSRQGYLSREDVATATLQVLEDSQYIHKVLTIQSNLPV